MQFVQGVRHGTAQVRFRGHPSLFPVDKNLPFFRSCIVLAIFCVEKLLIGQRGRVQETRGFDIAAREEI